MAVHHVVRGVVVGATGHAGHACWQFFAVGGNTQEMPSG